MRKKNDSTNKPAFEARLSHIRVTVWENSSESGVYHTVSIVRRYKDGDEWKSATSFSGIADLALLMESCRLARDFIASRGLVGGSDGE